MRHYVTRDLGALTVDFVHVYHRVVPLALRGRGVPTALPGGNQLRMIFAGWTERLFLVNL